MRPRSGFSTRRPRARASTCRSRCRRRRHGRRRPARRGRSRAAPRPRRARSAHGHRGRTTGDPLPETRPAPQRRADGRAPPPIRRRSKGRAAKRASGTASRASVTQFHGVGGVGGHRLRSVRRHHHGDAKLAVHAEKRMQEVLLGHWVQLGGGFVEQQPGALHRQRAGQRDHLLLAAESPSMERRNHGSMPKKCATSATRRRIASCGTPRFSRPKASSCHTESHTIWFSGLCAT